MGPGSWNTYIIAPYLHHAPHRTLEVSKMALLAGPSVRFWVWAFDFEFRD